MPPLPSLRCSPTREPRLENSHKRGRSFESGLTLKTKDDDLILFSEMQNRERDNFLLHTADDFEDSLSKLRHFSEFKLSISIPARGESSDLLNVEGDKNDYDWLLTPPDTPLFTSLDDDDPQPLNLASRGRPRSQPIMISRSLDDKSYPTSRTSSSPHRLSPSPRAGGPLAQMRGRPSSVPRSSPPPVICSPTPTRRPCTPPNKPSTPTSRSSTPTLRRMSTSSSIQSSNYGGRGASPVKANRGNSTSPKLREWKMTLSGFNSEVPPNLRTTLSDRPMSHIRSFSPARNGRESSVRLGRKSMSPTSSRSISSSHNQERDRFSSCSKGSVVSSGDDDDSLHSIKMGISRSPPSKKDGSLTNNKVMSFSRKPYRTSPSNSVPKRSFDSSLRLMDQHRKPQNMFRPLLSSVPATTFRPIFSRNSSLTTSSNASSEQGVISFAPDAEVDELQHNDLASGWERTEDSDTHEEVFLFDKVDEIMKDSNQEVLPGKHRSDNEDFDEISIKKIDPEDIQNCTVSICDATSSTTFESAYCADNHCDIDRYSMIASCCKCGKEFDIVDANGNRKLCKRCAEEGGLSTSGLSSTCMPLTKSEVLSQMNFLVDATSKEGLLNSGVPEIHEEGNGNIKLGQHERNNEPGADCLPKICSIHLDHNGSQLSDLHGDRKKDVNVTLDCRDSAPHMSHHAVNSCLSVDISEGTGISVLLQRSGSSKWPILQGKTLSATNILCSEPSYSRENINALRRNLGQDSTSASSSIDLGSSRQSDTYVHQQFTWKNEADSVRNDIDSNAQSTSSDNDASVSSCKSRHLRSERAEKLIRSVEFLGYDPLREIVLVVDEHTDSLDPPHINSTPSSMPIISENYMSEHSNDCRTVSNCESQIHAVDDPQNIGKTTDISVCSEMEEEYVMMDRTLENGILNAAIISSSIVNIESQDGFSEFEDSQTECMPSHTPAYPEDSNGHSISKPSENDLSISESITAVHEHEAAAIMVEGPRGHISRSLTLEEATDTILFCSSIIHDLAYKAATIAMEKELEVLPEPQALCPAVTFGKPIPDLRESGKMPNKYSPRSQKFKRKRMEAQTTSPTKEVENDVNFQEFTTSKAEIPRKVDSAKPPKLESKCNCTVM